MQYHFWVFMPVTRLPLLYVLFFGSGAAALGYQMAWTRMFTATLGHEIPAILGIVSAFLGGMAIGAWTLDRAISRSPHPGKWFAGLELLIAAWGLISSFLIPWGSSQASKLIGLHTGAFYWIISFTACFLILFPATFAMGATLPAMERFVVHVTAQQRCVGGVYAANTFGAVAGILLTVFFLAPTFGFRGTVWILTMVNFVTGLIALKLARGGRSEVVETDALPPANLIQVSQRRLLGSLLVSGLLAIGFEVLAVRVLAQVLENTIYSFASALATYLLATSLGAALFQRYGRFHLGPRLLFGQLIACSSACLGGMLVLSHARGLYDWSRDALGAGMVSALGAEIIVAAAVFAGPTFVMGTLFSHLLQMARKPNGGLGRGAALNTLGGSLAALIFGVGLLPIIGTKWTLTTVSLGYLALLPRLRGWSILSLLLPVLLLLCLPSNLQIVDLPPQGRLLEYREGRMATVTVVSDAAGERTLRVNNRFQMGGTAAAAAEYRHAHIPLLLHPRPRQALFLGLGTGITLGATTFYPDLHSDGVELIREVIAVMPQFAPANHAPAQDPNIALFNTDARRFIRSVDKRYDVVVADLFHPARDGAGTLYTCEHFEAIRRCLAPGGIFCQWLPLHQLDATTLRIIVRTFLEVFPEARACWLQLNVDIPVVGLVSGLNSGLNAPHWIEQHQNEPRLAAELKKLGLADSIRFFGLFNAGPEQLRQLGAMAPLNTDDRPTVMFSAPRAGYRASVTPSEGLSTFLALPVPLAASLLKLDPMPEAQSFAGRLEKYWKARDVYLTGLIKDANGQRTEAIDDYVTSARVSADFTPGYAQCLTRAAVLAKSAPAEARALLQRLVEAQPARPVAAEMLKRLGL